MSLVDARLRDNGSDKSSGLSAGCNKKCASKLFLFFYKTFHSFEMNNVGERKPQRDYFLFPSVGRALHFNEKKQITSQTITNLNLNGKFCNTVLKTSPKQCHPRQIGRAVAEGFVERSI